MEGKLAETAPKRPLALTIGAAAATLLVIFGIFAGPSVVSCFNSEEGLGICLRGKMAEAGLAPPLPATVTAEAEAAAEEPAAEVNLASTEEAVPPEAELDVTPPAEPLDVAAADAVISATFGLLRAEPDGSIVIAGSGTPGSKVEVFANGELLGSVDVEASGDWVFVPDTPLAPGDLEITLGEEGKTGTAEQSFIVVLNEDRTTQPLVVASTPGQASEVLQGLAETAPTDTDVAAAAEPPVEPAPVEVAAAPQAEQPATSPEAPGSEAAAPVAPAADTESAPAAEPPTDVAVLPAPVTPEPADAPVPPAAATVPEDTPDSEPEAMPAPAAASTQAEVETAIIQPTQAPANAVQPEPEATVSDVQQPALNQLAGVSPTIDAIELDGDRTFFAGGGPDGGTIRLYVDDEYVADATVDGGRWLIEAGPVLDQPNQRVRVDLLQDGNAQVVARAEVDFVVELPSVPGETTIIAEAEQPAAPTSPPMAEPAPAPAAQTTAAPASPEPATQPAAPAVDAAPSTPAAVPASEPAPAPASEQSAAPAPEPAAPPPTDNESVPVPAAPAEPAPPPAVETTPSTAPAPDAQPAVPTMVAVSLGDPDAQRFASGKAIIRRGDNLWTIARRVYGEGVKYTTIYQANDGQIRDPDRIYPGQVFNLPEGE